MSDEKRTITVFYSWQSDLPDESNRNFIRRALLNGADKISECRITIDEATRDTPGSPNIPKKILEKIRACDIFVSDITTINHSAERDRKTPNPNVVFELGYAVGEVGWDRIVMVFNREYGKFPDDAPFDFDRHRVYPYKMRVFRRICG